MDKTNKSTSKTYESRLKQIEEKVNELQTREKKYKNKIFELDLHRIEQIIEEVSYNYGSNGYLNKSRVIESCKYFFKQGVAFGEGKDIKLGLDSKHKFIY